MTQNHILNENVTSWTGRHIETETDGAANFFPTGAVLFGKLRPYLAKSLLTDFEGVCSGDFLIMMGEKVVGKYLNYFVRV